MRMSPTIDMLIERYGMPTGFRRISWDAVYEGQQVWVWGTDVGAPRAYGPHEIKARDRRQLTNRLGRTFLEYQESLLVKDEEPYADCERWIANFAECSAAIKAAVKGDWETAVSEALDAEDYANNSDYPERDDAFRRVVAYLEWKFNASYAQLKLDYGREDDEREVSDPPV